jgi:hypothetical protein
VLIAALALAAPAAAGTKTYSGTISPAGTISLDVKIKKGKAKNLKSLTFRDAPCTDGSDTGGDVNFSTKIKKKKFGISADSSSGSHLEVHGKVKKQTAAGSLEVSGPNCNTGQLSWSASR